LNGYKTALAFLRFLKKFVSGKDKAIILKLQNRLVFRSYILFFLVASTIFVPVPTVPRRMMTGACGDC
jgi:hypothetical protein